MPKLAIDVSHHQAGALSSFPGVSRGVIVRASYNGVPDAKFDEFVDAAIQSGVELSFYTYLEYAWRPAPPEEQIAVALNTVGDMASVIAVDFERPNRKWPELPPRATCLNMLERAFGKLWDNDIAAVLYTNPTTLRHLSPIPDWMLDNVALWIASYPYKSGTRKYCEGPDDIPAGFAPLTYGMMLAAWQFTNRMPGGAYGVKSASVDGSLVYDDVLMGLSDDYTDDVPQGESTRMPRRGIVKVFNPRFQHSRRRLHVSPSVKSRTCGYVAPGDNVVVYDVDLSSDGLSASALVYSEAKGQTGWLITRYGGHDVAAV